MVRTIDEAIKYLQGERTLETEQIIAWLKELDDYRQKDRKTGVDVVVSFLYPTTRKRAAEESARRAVEQCMKDCGAPITGITVDRVFMIDGNGNDVYE